ncbi:SusC/RagA family TonB-linked outer membrane protein [Kriegella sp. EG-1]|nr:SusC/RagA family TonB-linked outer membrane protein [Flavobacteriaceae bacterium EG-1]
MIMKKLFFNFLKKSFLMGLFFALMGMQYAHAQQTISGNVIDENGDPVPGANIVVKGTTNGTQSDFDGNYSIEASPEDVLVISYIGYATQSITIGNQTSINTQLVLDQQQLDEVVVIGYGTVKKSDVTGAVTRVDSKSFENQPLTRVEEALQGRAAGVTVAKANGAPGANIKVRIRGVNSITGNNDPLVVIDGILGGDLSTINPNDIAAMDVLKDASATAIYGVRGSNGVIIITTKKGSGKGKVNVDFFTTFSNIPKLIPTLADNPGEFARIENLRRVSTGGSPVFTDAEISALETNGGTNYQDEILRSGVSKNLQLSASGSEGSLRYFISGNYRDEEGIVINTGYQQLSLRSNLEAKISDRFTTSLNIYGSRGEIGNNFQTFGSGQGSLMYKANTWDPSTPIFDADGNYNKRSIKGIGSLNQNPVLTLNGSDFSDVEEKLNSALNMRYSITDNLSFSTVIGTQLSNYNIQRYANEGNNEIPDASFSNNKITSYQVSNILTWQKEFGKHDIKLTGVQEYQNTKNVYNQYTANDLALPNGFYFAELAPNAGQTVSNNFSERELSSWMLRAEYILNDNLFLTATGRYDGTSVFRPGKKWGFFPSLALAYSLNGVVENSEFLSAFKLRAGWGQVGNQGISTYGTFASLGVNSYAPNGSAAGPGTFINSFANEELTWETTTQTNAGIDIGFSNGRGNFSVDVYQKLTTDLLLEVPVPTTNGGGVTIENIGEVKNYGYDITLGYDIIDSEDFNWSSNVSLSYTRNEVTSLFDGLEEIEGQFAVPGGQARRANLIQLNEPLGQFNGAKFLGTWKTSEAAQAAVYDKVPGEPKYLRDENGEIWFGAIGNGSPTTFWGWNNTLTYKNLELNVFFSGAGGFEVYNLMQAGITGGAGDSRSFMAANQVNQWTPQNETDIPNTVQLFNSSRYVEKGDFARLSNLTLGYTIKDVLGLDSIKIYGGGQNLFLITDYSGYDPESTSRRTDQGNEDVAAGVQVGSYPNPRTYTLGVKVGF